MTVKWHYASTLAGNPDGLFRTYYDIGGDDNSNVALVYPSEDGDEDTLRKARLIAASPDLLAALKRMIFDWDGEPEDIAEAQDAIAKAEGEPTHNSPPVLGSEFRRRLG